MIMIMIIMKIIVIRIIVTIARRPFALSHEFLPTIFSIILIIIFNIIIVNIIIVITTNTTREGVTSLMEDNSANFCAGLSSLNLTRSRISRVIASPMLV